MGRTLNPTGDPYTRICDAGNGTAAVIQVRPDFNDPERTSDDKAISDEYEKRGLIPC